MPSPFPGMNPYLEQPSCWEAFHNAVCGRTVESLVPQLGSRYIVKLHNRLYIHEQSAEQQHYLGADDASISEPSQPPADVSVATATHMTAPLYGEIPQRIEVEKQPYIEIEDREFDRVVTSIEFLSPANKYSGEDRDQYLAIRRLLLHSQTHLVEIDLRRGGPRMPVEDLPDCDYCANVSRSYERPRVGIWSWQIRDPIPFIPIPVNESDNDVQLDLKPLVESIHDSMGFVRYIYRGAPEPRLRPDDQQWSQSLLREANLLAAD